MFIYAHSSNCATFTIVFRRVVLHVEKKQKPDVLSVGHRAVILSL